MIPQAWQSTSMTCDEDLAPDPAWTGSRPSLGAHVTTRTATASINYQLGQFVTDFTSCALSHVAVGSSFSETNIPILNDLWPGCPTIVADASMTGYSNVSNEAGSAGWEVTNDQYWFNFDQNDMTYKRRMAILRVDIPTSSTVTTLLKHVNPGLFPGPDAGGYLHWEHDTGWNMSRPMPSQVTFDFQGDVDATRQSGSLSVYAKLYNSASSIDTVTPPWSGTGGWTSVGTLTYDSSGAAPFSFNPQVLGSSVVATGSAYVQILVALVPSATPPATPSVDADSSHLAMYSWTSVKTSLDFSQAVRWVSPESPVASAATEGVNVAVLDVGVGTEILTFTSSNDGVTLVDALAWPFSPYLVQGFSFPFGQALGDVRFPMGIGFGSGLAKTGKVFITPVGEISPPTTQDLVTGSLSVPYAHGSQFLPVLLNSQWKLLDTEGGTFSPTITGLDANWYDFASYSEGPYYWVSIWNSSLSTYDWQRYSISFSTGVATEVGPRLSLGAAPAGIAQWSYYTPSNFLGQQIGDRFAAFTFAETAEGWKDLWLTLYNIETGDKITQVPLYESGPSDASFDVSYPGNAVRFVHGVDGYWLCYLRPVPMDPWIGTGAANWTRVVRRSINIDTGVLGAEILVTEGEDPWIVNRNGNGGGLFLWENVSREITPTASTTPRNNIRFVACAGTTAGNTLIATEDFGVSGSLNAYRAFSVYVDFEPPNLDGAFVEDRRNFIAAKY